MSGGMICIDRHIVVWHRAYRSKWFKLCCTCRRRRKDGTCKHLHAARDCFKPPFRDRVKFDTTPMGAGGEA